MKFEAYKNLEILKCSLCESSLFHIVRNIKTDSMTLGCAHCGNAEITFGAGITIKEVIQTLKGD